MGDEKARDSGYVNVNLGNKDQVPGVLCAPLGAREAPLIPITDHGDGRHWGLLRQKPRDLAQQSELSHTELSLTAMNHGKITAFTIIGDAPQSSAELAAATPLTRGQTSGSKFPLGASATAHSRPDRVEWAVFSSNVKQSRAFDAFNRLMRLDIARFRQ
jgi:hypothetical protein